MGVVQHQRAIKAQVEVSGLPFKFFYPQRARLLPPGLDRSAPVLGQCRRGSDLAADFHMAEIGFFQQRLNNGSGYAVAGDVEMQGEAAIDAGEVSANDAAFAG